MPYRKRPRRRFRRKTRRYSRGYAKRTRTLFGNKLVTRLKFQQVRTLDPGIVGVPAIQVYRANSLFDPDLTATGHQPRGRDQLFTMFNNAVVIGCKITIEGSHTSGIHNTIVGIAVRASSTVETDINSYLESRNVKHTMLSGGSNTEPRKLSYKVNPNKFLGISKPLANSKVLNTDTANPDTQCFFHIFAGPTEFVDSQPVHFNVQMEFTCVFIKPKLPPQS